MLLLSQLFMNLAYDKSYIQLNQNFDKVAIMHRSNTPAAPSGIDKIDYVTFQQRGDGNYGRATFIAEFAPGAGFPPHDHPYGEEVYVLKGMLTDQGGNYPQGYYIRQAIGSEHTPFSKDGTRLFVKMWQMPLSSSEKVLVNTNTLEYTKIQEGISQTSLFQSAIEHVSLYRLTKGSIFHNAEKEDVSEILVISGLVKIYGSELETESWIRIPRDTKYEIEAKQESLIYVKIGKGVVRGKNWEQVTF